MRSHCAGDSVVSAFKKGVNITILKGKAAKISAQSEDFCVSFEQLRNLMAGHVCVAKQLQMSLPAQL